MDSEFECSEFEPRLYIEVGVDVVKYLVLGPVIKIKMCPTFPDHPLDHDDWKFLPTAPQVDHWLSVDSL